MKIDGEDARRLRMLVSEIELLSGTLYYGEHEYESFVDPVNAYQWSYKGLNALENIFGDKSRFFLDSKEDFEEFGNNDALDELKKTNFRASEGLISNLMELDAERKRRELS